MRGVISAAGYVPHCRLNRSEIHAFLGTGGGRGTRAVACYDEDTTTLGDAAADLTLRASPEDPEALWFVTSRPAYLEKTNATAVHAALELPARLGALDFGGALRSGLGALRTALTGGSCTLVVTADLRDGLPTSSDEANAGDGAAAVLVGGDCDGAVLAELLASSCRTLEITDRWRVAEERVSRSWEQRFAETVYTPVAAAAWNEAITDAGLADAQGVDRLIVTGLNDRAVAAAVRAIGRDVASIVDPLADTVGNTGTAHAALLLCSALEQARPGEIIAVMGIADGVEVIVLRATDALAQHRPWAPLAEQVEAGTTVGYGRFLAWREMLTIEPPNRPPPARTSSPAAHRSTARKFGFSGRRRTPGTVTSFTVDRLAYSPSPPTVLAIVDFDDGERMPVQLTEATPDEVHTGMRVVPTFRRIGSTEGIHNYFWKVRPLRGGEQPLSGIVA